MGKQVDDHLRRPFKFLATTFHFKDLGLLTRLTISKQLTGSLGLLLRVLSVTDQERVREIVSARSTGVVAAYAP